MGADPPVRSGIPRIVWPLAALAVLVVGDLVLTPHFGSVVVRDGRLYGIPVDILERGATTIILALGMTVVIATGGIDLSVGAVMAIAGAVAAMVARSGAGAAAAVACALAAGLAAGLWNGVLIAIFGVQPIVATLVLMVAGRGIAQLLSGGQVIPIDDAALRHLGDGALLGLPAAAVIALALFAATAIVVRGTALGLFLSAVGANPAAARIAGIPAVPLRLMAHAFCSICAALAGVLAAADIAAADANNAGMLAELDAILAAVLGGTALQGGRFSLGGAVIAALTTQTLTTSLYLHDVSAAVMAVPKAGLVFLVGIFHSPRVQAALSRLRGARAS